MTAKPDNPPAFPLGSGDERDAQGMHLRDWFAGMALQGLLANPDRHLDTPSLAARDAYVTADAMLEQRTKTDDR